MQKIMMRSLSYFLDKHNDIKQEIRLNLRKLRPIFRTAKSVQHLFFRIHFRIQLRVDKINMKLNVKQLRQQETIFVTKFPTSQFILFYVDECNYILGGLLVPLQSYCFTPKRCLGREISDNMKEICIFYTAVVRPGAHLWFKMLDYV